jgi:hypothetical protein
MAIKQQTAELQPLNIQTAKIKVKGLSPLIMHRWDEKAKKQMLDKQMKKTVKKEAKDPEEQFKSSLYQFDDGRYGFPADGFKKCMIRGAKQLGLVMIDMKTAVFVEGEYSKRDDRELVEIKGKLTMREDMVTISGGTADIRYRGQLADWSAELTISYNASITSFDHIVNMLNAGGFGVGVGEWRPDKNGMFGRFSVIA